MELVLGLATLATAISGAAGAGHYSSSGKEVSKAETTVQTMNETIHEANLGAIRELAPEKAVASYYSEVENNNTVATAQDVGQYMDQNSWSFTNYGSGSGPSISSVEIHGNIDADKGVDWYTFDMFGKGSISIDLSRIPADCDYDLRLYRKSNVANAELGAGVTEIASSTKGSNSNERISKTLNAGVYYVKVYSYKGFGYTQYYLNLNAQYQRQDVCIEDMMAKDAKGALWLADYDPFGIQPSMSLDSSVVGEKITKNDSAGQHVEKDTYHPEFPFEMNHPYKQAEFFVWNRDYRKKLRNLAYTMLQKANENYTNAKNLYMKAEQQQTGANIVVTILGEVAGAFVPYVSWTMSAFGLLLDIVNLFFPEGNRFEKYTNIIDYIGDLYTALETDAYTSETEVVRIPIRYSFDVSSNFVVGPGMRPTYTRTTTTYSMSYAPTERQWNYLYDDGGKRPGQNRYIHAIDHEGQSPFAGTIYPIRFDNDVTRAFSERKVRNLDPRTLTINQDSSISGIAKGEYEWFKFTAPHTGDYRIRSSGDSSAAVHVYDHVSKSTYPYAGTDGIIAMEYQTPGYEEGFSYDFHLNAGEVRYFRVCGTVDGYQRLYNTTVTLTEIAAGMVARINASDIGLPTNLNNPFFFGNISNPCNVYVTACNAFYNTDRGCIEMICDRDNNKPWAYVIMFFGRPIKQLNFGSCIGNGYSYACLGLYLQGLNQYGFPVTEDVFGSYCNDELLPYGLRYDNRDEAICGVMFRIDPETDQSPYHVGYQEQLLGNFVVEFAD